MARLDRATGGGTAGVLYEEPASHLARWQQSQDRVATDDPIESGHDGFASRAMTGLRAGGVTHLIPSVALL